MSLIEIAVIILIAIGAPLLVIMAIGYVPLMAGRSKTALRECDARRIMAACLWLFRQQQEPLDPKQKLYGSDYQTEHIAFESLIIECRHYRQSVDRVSIYSEAHQQVVYTAQRIAAHTSSPACDAPLPSISLRRFNRGAWVTSLLQLQAEISIIEAAERAAYHEDMFREID